MTIKIKDSICFVTGANRGIGRAIVEELIKHGAAKVYAAARNIESLKELASDSQGKIVPVQLDVTNEAQIKAAAKIAADTQILINNAGIAHSSAVIAAPDTEPARAEMEVNYFGVLHMTRAFAPILGKNGGGALVNIASVLAFVSAPAFGTYSASKAAVHSLTQGARAELKAQQTLVVGVYPGPIDTEMSAHLTWAKESPQNVAKEIFQAIETGAEECYPDPTAKATAAKLKTDAKAVEREWGAMLPQSVGA